MKILRYILALKFAFVIIFEHFVFGICKLIDVMVPDIPYSLDIKIKRERYLAKQALQVSIHNFVALVIGWNTLMQDAEHITKTPTGQSSQEVWYIIFSLPINILFLEISYFLYIWVYFIISIKTWNHWNHVLFILIFVIYRYLKALFLL